MLKWILIIAGVIMLGVLGTCFWGYKQITSGGPTASVMVQTTPERAWGWLSNQDSLQALADSGMTVRVSGNGLLEVGDSLTVHTSMKVVEGASPDIVWVVTRVEAPHMRAFSARQDPSKPGALERVDSLVQVGDSVRISSTYSVSTPAGSPAATKGKVESAMLGSAAKVLVGAMRHLGQHDLENLKARLEHP